MKLDSEEPTSVRMLNFLFGDCLELSSGRLYVARQVQ